MGETERDVEIVTGNQPAISLRGVSKKFGKVVAVDSVDLDVEAGEFFALLGPSGSGKTTLLRMIAGFELPSSGTVRLGGTDVTTDPPFDRDVNTVFQDYALFPHMTVAKNIEYGLRVRKVPKQQRTERVAQALASVRLDGYGDRKPSQLSGGQRQRVALARALVNRPRVLLLDEPLGALDLKLREDMQVELKAIQREAGITFVFVTHDQGEALTMSDRIAVFNNGRIEQIGTPQDMYQRPASEFVAGFVGASNLLRGDDAETILGRRASFMIRPEVVRLIDPTSSRGDSVVVDATVIEIQYLGNVTRVCCSLASGTPFAVDLPGSNPAPDRGSTVHLAFTAADCHVLRTETSTN